MSHITTVFGGTGYLGQRIVQQPHGEHQGSLHSELSYVSSCPCDLKYSLIR